MELQIGQTWVTNGKEYFIAELTATHVTYELAGRQFTISRRTMEDIINGETPLRAKLKI